MEWQLSLDLLILMMDLREELIYLLIMIKATVLLLLLRKIILYIINIISIARPNATMTCDPSNFPEINQSSLASTLPSTSLSENGNGGM